MRLAAAALSIAFLVCSCSAPPTWSMGGTWDLVLDQQSAAGGYDEICSGSMALEDRDGQVAGPWQCASATMTWSGNVTGERTDSAVDLQLYVEVDAKVTLDTKSTSASGPMTWYAAPGRLRAWRRAQ